jgi:hypothetical protein
MECINQSHFGRLSEPKKITKDNILVAREIEVAQSNNFLKNGKIMLFLLILLEEWLI